MGTLRRFRETTGKPIGWLLGEDLLLPQQPTPTTDKTPEPAHGEFVFVPRFDANAEQSFSMAFRKYWIEKYLNADPANLSVHRIEDDVMEPQFQRADNVWSSPLKRRTQSPTYNNG